MAVDGSIRIDTKVDEKGFNQGITSMIAAVRRIGIAIGVAFGIRQIAQFGQSAVKEAAAIAEQYNKFNVVFKEFAGSATAALSDFADQTGRSINELIGFASTIQDTFVPLGIARGKAAELSVEVVKLATDLSSFNDIPTADVVRDIQSALVGNFETVRKYGAVLSEATVKQKAQELGLYSGTGAINAQARSLAALALIQSSNTDAMDDATLTAGSFANQMRGISSALLDLRIAVGNSIIPIIQKILPYIRAAIDALTAFFTRLATIVGILFGVDIASQASAAGAAIGGVGETANDAADAQDKLAGSTEKAGKAAKGALASFDQLNVLQQDTGSAGAGAGGVPDLGGAGGFDLPAPETGAFEDGLDELREKVLQWKSDFLTFFQPVVDAFGRLKESLEPLGQTIWAGLQWAWENILKPLGEWAVQSLVPAVFDLIGAAAETLNDALIALQPLGLWLWEDFLQPLGQFTGDLIIAALEWITEQLQLLGDWINENPEKFETFVSIIGALAAAFLIVAGVFQVVSVLMGVYAAVTSAAAVATALLASPVFLIAAAVVALIAIIILLVKYWDVVKQAALDTWAGILAVWLNVATWFETKVVDPIQNAFSTMLDNVKQRFATIFQGIKDIVRNAINGVIRIINNMISGFANSFNTIANVAGAIGVSIPTITAPQIPYLAKGAVIPPNGEFLAMLGDQRSGRNLEAPEGLIRQIFREEMNNMGGGGSDIKIEFTGSLASLARVLEPQIKKESKRRGISLANGA